MYTNFRTKYLDDAESNKLIDLYAPESKNSTVRDDYGELIENHIFLVESLRKN